MLSAAPQARLRYYSLTALEGSSAPWRFLGEPASTEPQAEPQAPPGTAEGRSSLGSGGRPEPAHAANLLSLLPPSLCISGTF